MLSFQEKRGRNSYMPEDLLGMFAAIEMSRREGETTFALKPNYINGTVYARGLDLDKMQQYFPGFLRISSMHLTEKPEWIKKRFEEAVNYADAFAQQQAYAALERYTARAFNRAVSHRHDYAPQTQEVAIGFNRWFCNDKSGPYVTFDDVLINAFNVKYIEQHDNYSEVMLTGRDRQYGFPLTLNYYTDSDKNSLERDIKQAQVRASNIAPSGLLNRPFQNSPR